MSRIFVVIAIILLSGCASVDKEASWTQEDFYKAAKKELDARNFVAAIKFYDSLQARYPYGVYADQANLDVAYAQYKLKEKEQVIAECDRFIQLHPTHPNVDYAYYLKGLSQELNLDGLFDFIAQQDPTERDPEASQGAFTAFNELVTRFPNSIYAADARRRMEKLKQNLAGHELHVARYYLKRGAPIAAANRAKTILEKFPTAPEREEALAILITAHNTLGETQLRDDARRVLALNYPDSPYLDSYKPQSKGVWWAIWTKF